MNVNKLAYVKEAKYLGVIICNDLTQNFTTVPRVLKTHF